MTFPFVVDFSNSFLSGFMFCFNCVASFSCGTSSSGNIVLEKQGVVVEKVALLL